MRKFLIVKLEWPEDWSPVVVMATCVDEALRIYLRRVYSKSENFREWTQDFFVERFFPDDYDSSILLTDVKHLAEMQRSVMLFFAERPDLGELCCSYLENADESIFTDELYEFIALKEDEDEHGLRAVDIDACEVLIQ